MSEIQHARRTYLLLPLRQIASCTVFGWVKCQFIGYNFRCIGSIGGVFHTMQEIIQISSCPIVDQVLDSRLQRTALFII